MAEENKKTETEQITEDIVTENAKLREENIKLQKERDEAVKLNKQFYQNFKNSTNSIPTEESKKEETVEEFKAEDIKKLWK